MQRVIKIVFLLLLAALLCSCEKNRNAGESDTVALKAEAIEHEKCPSGRCPSVDKSLKQQLENVAGPENPIGNIYSSAKPGNPDKDKRAPEAELEAAYVKMDEGPIPKLADSIDLTSVPGRLTGIASGNEGAKAIEKVLAMRKDMRWYLADIIQPGDDKLKIRYIDGEEAKVQRRFIRPVLKALEDLLVVGDYYLINRNGDGIFYLATVLQHKEQRLEVVYNEDLEKASIHIKNAVFFSPWPRSAPNAQFEGQPVLALWEDGRYYKGVTSGIENGTALVRFNDGREEHISVGRTRVLLLPGPTLLNPGSITMANRNGLGAYFPAWITGVKKEKVGLQYLDDGYSETLPASSLAQY